LSADLIATLNEGFAAMAGKLYKKEQVAGLMKQHGIIPAGQ
jgi:hypothetical protein